MSRATQDATRAENIFVYRVITSFDAPFQMLPLTFSCPTAWSYNPRIAETIRVWAVPRSLATTGGITVVFFSSGY